MYSVRMRNAEIGLMELRRNLRQKTLNKNQQVNLTCEEFDDLLRILQDLVEEVKASNR